MPYKKELHTIHCPKCNNDFTVLTPAYLRKQKDLKYGSYCSSCRAKILWEEMTPEQKDLMNKKSHESLKEKYSQFSDEKKKEMITKRREGVKKFWDNMTEDERKCQSEKRSNDRKEFLVSRTEEEMKIIGQNISKGKLNAFAAMSDEERAIRKLQKQEEMERYWNSLSDEDREVIRERLRNNNKQFILQMSDEEREKRRQSMISRMMNFWNNSSDEIIQERKKKLTQYGEEYRANVSDEDKQIVREKISISSKTFWKNISDNQRQDIANKKRLTWESQSQEVKDEISKRSKEIITQYLSSLTDEEREARLKVLQDANKLYRENLTDEDKIEISKMLKNYWANISDEERERISKLRKTQWENLTDEEKEKTIKKLNDSGRKYWDNLSEEAKDKISQRNSDRFKQYYENLTSEELENIKRKRLIHAMNNNGLHQKFNDTFNNSILSNQYRIEVEFKCNCDSSTHSWDYAIFDKETNSLEMLIDLDGAYFHADNCDYDGIRSREEYDERRSLSIPDGIKSCIIHEFQFKKSFENMIKLLMINYDDFIMNQFQYCRSIEFPFPKYTDKELIKSYDQLLRMDCDSKYITMSTNSRLGDRIISHFHPSIYLAHVGKCLSPYDAWYDDNILKDVIKNRMIYVNTLNPNKILQGFNVCKIAPKVSVFSAGRSKVLIDKYLNDMNEIYDPFAGFGGRMLGTISLNKKYIGQDISDNHIKESQNMYGFISKHFKLPEVELHDGDILQSTGEYESLFTCPPYGDKESWHYVDPTKMSCDDWIDECLKRFKCKKYLFIVDNTIKYKDYIIDEIVNKSHFGSNSEYVILINK